MGGGAKRPSPSRRKSSARRAAAERQAADERARAEAAERAREQEAAAERRREEQAAAERARAEAAEEAARKEAARRHARLVELADEAVKAAPLEDLAAARRQFSVIRREWNSLAAAGRGRSRSRARAMPRPKRRSPRATRAAHEEDQRARREALARLQQLVGRDRAARRRAPTSSLKAGERALKDIRTALGTIPQLPSKQDYDEIVRRLKAAQTALMPKVQELRDVADWQRWANVGIQEQLCEKMEALKSVEDPEEIAKQVRDLQQQWRQAADVPRAQGEALWRRFKAAHDDAWTRCEAHFAAQTEARAGNLAKKIALSERAEALAESTNWIQTADEIKKLQAEWKTIGPVSRGQEKAIWERFRAACDRFFTRRHADLAERKTMWAENLAKKEALCVKVEALARLDRLGRRRGRDQAAAGRVEDDRPGEEDALRSDLAALPRRVRRVLRPLRAAPRHRARRTARRARGDCRGAGRPGGDSAVSRQSTVGQSTASRQKSGRRQSAGRQTGVGERTVRRRGRRSRAPSPQADAVRSRRDPQSEEPPAGSDGAGALAARASGSTELAARGVDRDAAAALDARFAAAFSGVLARWPAVFGGTDLDPDANRKRMEALVQRMEDLAKSLAGPAAQRRRGAVADHAARGDAEGSAGREHHRRQGGRRQPVPRRATRKCGRRRRAGRASAPCPRRRAARWPTASSARSAASRMRAASGAAAMAGAGRSGGSSGPGRPGGAGGSGRPGRTS